MYASYCTDIRNAHPVFPKYFHKYYWFFFLCNHWDIVEERRVVGLSSNSDLCSMTTWRKTYKFSFSLKKSMNFKLDTRTCVSANPSSHEVLYSFPRHSENQFPLKALFKSRDLKRTGLANLHSCLTLTWFWWRILSLYIPAWSRIQPLVVSFSIQSHIPSCLITNGQYPLI